MIEMVENVVSYVGISDRVAYRKLILLSSKDIITALNTYEQIKVIRKKKHELMKQVDESISSIVKVKEKLEKSFPASAYEALVKSVKVEEDEKSEKDFEKYLTKMKGVHKTTKKTSTKKSDSTKKTKAHKTTKKTTTKVSPKTVETKNVKSVNEPKKQKDLDVETEIEVKREVSTPKVERAPSKKLTRFEKLQQELEDIESKLSNL